MVLRGRGTHVCLLCCSFWLIIVTNYKDTYTLIICIQYIVTHLLEQTISPIFKCQAVREMSVSINLFWIPCQKSKNLMYNAAES